MDEINKIREQISALAQEVANLVATVDGEMLVKKADELLHECWALQSAVNVEASDRKAYERLRAKYGDQK